MPPKAFLLSLPSRSPRAASEPFDNNDYYYYLFSLLEILAILLSSNYCYLLECLMGAAGILTSTPAYPVLTKSMLSLCSSLRCFGMLAPPPRLLVVCLRTGLFVVVDAPAASSVAGCCPYYGLSCLKFCLWPPLMLGRSISTSLCYLSSSLLL